MAQNTSQARSYIEIVHTAAHGETGLDSEAIWPVTHSVYYIGSYGFH